jgi:hypothetical protein
MFNSLDFKEVFQFQFHNGGDITNFYSCLWYLMKLVVAGQTNGLIPEDKETKEIFGLK